MASPSPNDCQSLTTPRVAEEVEDSLSNTHQNGGNDTLTVEAKPLTSKSVTETGSEELNRSKVHNAEGQEPSFHDREIEEQPKLHKELQNISVSEKPRDTTAPAHTYSLFPPLPTYAPPSLLRSIQHQILGAVSFCLSSLFLGVIVLGAVFNVIPIGLKNLWFRSQCHNPSTTRPFYAEERERKRARKEAVQWWKRQRQSQQGHKGREEVYEEGSLNGEFPPSEGGKDPLVDDVGYYARRVGLDVETFKVQTEDGFILTLWHVYNPNEYIPLPQAERDFRQPQPVREKSGNSFATGNRRFPVLFIHGLLQSSGVYCANDDDSLAFFLCKSGYDVWLGNNRCVVGPEHAVLAPSDPRMWAWNIHQMGVLDLPALTSRVLYETGFEKLALICHSQGTAEAMMALSKDHQPELGNRLSVFCALAPAAYAGPLIHKIPFGFMHIISPGMFRMLFGNRAFIPFMIMVYRACPPRLYGALGYWVFSYLFGWTDAKWDRGLRSRMFQFGPVYVSAESMRWWLGQEGFAKQKCILSTREESKREEEEDRNREGPLGSTEERGMRAWFGPQAPPFALWIAGSDGLVDGARLLQRFQNGREPHIRVVHSKTIGEYEHLDVLWAMDSIDQVGREVRDVIWQTIPDDARAICRVPKGVKAPGQ
jgi:pimeloyl-ACP methyl ester carboxylesterase